MKIIARSTLLISLLTATSNAVVHTMDAGMEGTGFSAEGTVRLDNNLPGNLDIIGAHLHTGSETVNGPVNIVFCGGFPLPSLLAINGECNSLQNQSTERNTVNVTDWEALTSKGAWMNTANDATSLANVTTLADGSPTTYESFMTALNDCTKDNCAVYFNIHTNYSFAENADAFGLARGQLVPVDCPSNKTEGAKCFGGTVTSENTNKVNGLTNQLPEGAGLVLPISGDVLITYIGDDVVDDDKWDIKNDSDDNMFGINDDVGYSDDNSSKNDDSAATDYSLPLRSMTVVAAIFSTFLI
jgi:hypothetical protein